MGKQITSTGMEIWTGDDWSCVGRHRLDGPAIIIRDDKKEWWIADTQVSEEIIDWIQKYKLSWPFDIDARTRYILTWGEWPFRYHDMIMSTPEQRRIYCK